MDYENFGRKIQIEVKDSNKEIIFTTDSLRVDFKISQVSGYDRAEFKIFNLKPETIKDITNGERYITLKTKLHDENYVVLASEMFVSNSYNELIRPNNITSLYCYSNLRKTFLEKQVRATIKKPSLRNLMNELARVAGDSVFFEYKNFPEQNLKQISKASYVFDGSAENMLKDLGLEWNFMFYVQGGNKIVIDFIPETYNVNLTELGNGPGDTVLNIENLRSNPVIGANKINIVSVLDSNIFPTVTLDAGNLITATTDIGFEALAAAENLLKTSVSAFSKYQVITVEHEGSNFTNKWETRAMGIAPAKGTRMPTNSFNWHGG